MTTETTNRWTPVKRGLLYCSPGCGRGCTIMEYRKAVEEADKLVARLGPGWNPVVSENLGWHYKAVDDSGLFKVSTGDWGKCYYAALLGDMPSAGIWSATAETPELAIQKCLEQARAELSRIESIATSAKRTVDRLLWSTKESQNTP